MSERFEDLPLDSRVNVVYERAVHVEPLAEAAAFPPTFENVELGGSSPDAVVAALPGWYAVIDAENDLVCLVPPGGIDKDANADDVPGARASVVAAMLNQVAPGGRAELLRGDAVSLANNQRVHGKHAVRHGELVGTPAWVTDAVVEAYARGARDAAPLAVPSANRQTEESVSGDSKREQWTHEVEVIDGQIAAMRNYLALVTSRSDYHGVMDAAADIRELNARRAVFVGLLEKQNQEPSRLNRNKDLQLVTHSANGRKGADISGACLLISECRMIALTGMSLRNVTVLCTFEDLKDADLMTWLHNEVAPRLASGGKLTLQLV